MKITVAGLGPGDIDYMLPVVKNALQKADVVIGYDYYFQFGASLFKADAELISMPLGKEEARAHKAIEKANEDKYVVVIGSGDASIYAMAAIVYEVVSKENHNDIELETLPGVSALSVIGLSLVPFPLNLICKSL